MDPTDSPLRTLCVHGACASAALALTPARAGAEILVVVLRVDVGSRVAAFAGVGAESMALVWAWETAPGARTVGASRTGRSNARPISRQALAGACLADRTRRTGWRIPCSGR